MRTAFILSLLFFLLCSCGKKASKEVDKAIDLAQTYLSSNECEKAIKVLEEVGRDRSNSDYLQVLASAYSCRAGYSDITFISTELSKILTTEAGLMPSLTQLKWSPETVADSFKYKALRESLNILLNVDSTQPSQAAREAKYGPRDADDMGVQALLLSFVQLGKYLYFYGNVNAAGLKGQGPGTSKCFVTYTDDDANTFLSGGGGGACVGINGHPNMSFAPTDLVTTKRRMCEVLMIVTNIIDILSNFTFAPGSSLAALNSAATSVIAIKTGIVTLHPSLSTLMETTSQDECEALVSVTEFDNLQHLFARLFEAGLP